MPIFEYECPRGHKFDKIVPIAQMDDLQECPGHMVTVEPQTDPAFRVVSCRAPAKRIPVPSRPAHIIIR